MSILKKGDKVIRYIGYLGNKTVSKIEVLEVVKVGLGVAALKGGVEVEARIAGGGVVVGCFPRGLYSCIVYTKQKEKELREALMENLRKEIRVVLVELLNESTLKRFEEGQLEEVLEVLKHYERLVGLKRIEIN